MGAEAGMNDYANRIRSFIRENFPIRNLTFFNVKSANYGDVAWLEFYHVFDATMKLNNPPVQTRGAETQKSLACTINYTSLDFSG
jgi:hypothetical protein